MPPNNPTPNKANKPRRKTATTILLFGLLGVALAHIMFGYRIAMYSCTSTHNQIAKLSEQFKQDLAKRKELANLNESSLYLADTLALKQYRELHEKTSKLVDSTAAMNACRASKDYKELDGHVKEIESQYRRAAASIVEFERSADDMVDRVNRKKIGDLRDSAKLRIDQLNENMQSPLLSQEYKTSINEKVNQITKSLSRVGGAVEELTKINNSLQALVNDVNKELVRATSNLSKTESAVQSINNYMDNSGTYMAAAKDILRAAGKEMVVGIDKASGHCDITDEQATTWLAAYCPNTSDKVYVNPVYFSTTAYSPYFADTMRHELGHNFIYNRCGTTSPKSITGTANEESTASAYAVLYLGASEATLNQASDPRYIMTADAFASAQKIRAGQCG